MRGVAAGDDERRDLETQEVFGLRPGRGVAIEHRPSHPDDELLIAIGVLLHERFGEGRIARDHGRPRTAPGIDVERLAVLLHERDDGFETFTPDERQMLGKAFMAAHPILRAADRPIEDHAQGRVRMHHREGQDRRAAHARAHDVGALDPQMLQQALSLGDVVGPGHALEPTARTTCLAPIEHDAGIPLRQMIEQLDRRIDPLRAPLLYGRIEAAGRIHEYRRPRTHDLIIGRDAVDDRARHPDYDTTPYAASPARAYATSFPFPVTPIPAIVSPSTATLIPPGSPVYGSGKSAISIRRSRRCL